MSAATLVPLAPGSLTATTLHRLWSTSDPVTLTPADLAEHHLIALTLMEHLIWRGHFDANIETTTRQQCADIFGAHTANSGHHSQGCFSVLFHNGIGLATFNLAARAQADSSVVMQTKPYSDDSPRNVPLDVILAAQPR